MESSEQTGLAQLSTARVRQLVEGLNSLMEGESAAAMLVACGARAIPFVSDFLIHGRPASVSEPRRRAVRVLADLEAVNELVRYLELEKNITDPVLKLSEESVESLAAELLARWPTEEVFRALLGLSQRRKLIGLCAAFGKLRRPEAIPVLIRDLGDGVCSRPAEDALLQIGRIAIPELISAALNRQLKGETEIPSNLQRRRSALRVLLSMGLRQGDWAVIRSLSHADDPEIRAYACIIGLASASEAERNLLASQMLTVVQSVNWFIQSEIQETLLANYESLGWVVRQFANAPTRPMTDASKRLALAIVAAATGAPKDLRTAPIQRTWLSRVCGKLFSMPKRRRLNEAG